MASVALHLYIRKREVEVFHALMPLNTIAEKKAPNDTVSLLSVTCPYV
jgi:hypothetical protein